MKTKKNALTAALALVALTALVCACASGGKAASESPAAANPETTGIDAVIQEASEEINNELSAGTKVALLNFSSDSDVFSEYVLEEMSILLVKERKLVVVDRKEIDLIRGEMNFQMSGEVSDESAQEIGIKLGAQSIVSGSLVKTSPDTYRFRTRVINVESAVIEASSSISVKEDTQIQFLLSQGKRSPAPQAAVAQGNMSAATTATPAQATPAPAPAPTTVVPPLPAYKIGDTGPAGGLIFYDKGNNFSGWQYLEAAPAEAEFVAVWSVRNTNVENTRDEIGAGKRNTQLFVEAFSKASGEWDTAAQKADDLVINGFDDWFIPSSAELDQMYGNLKRRNLGDFKNDYYWTSTGYSSTSSYNMKVQGFGNGRMEYSGYSNRYFVRPIRQVNGPGGPVRSSIDNATPVATSGGGSSGTTSSTGATAGSAEPSSGGGVGFYTVLSVIGGLGLAGYLVYLMITDPPEPEMRHRMNIPIFAFGIAR